MIQARRPGSERSARGVSAKLHGQLREDGVEDAEAVVDVARSQELLGGLALEVDGLRRGAAGTAAR